MGVLSFTLIINIFFIETLKNSFSKEESIFLISEMKSSVLICPTTERFNWMLQFKMCLL